MSELLIIPKLIYKFRTLASAACIFSNQIKQQLHRNFHYKLKPPNTVTDPGQVALIYQITLPKSGFIDHMICILTTK